VPVKRQRRIFALVCLLAVVSGGCVDPVLLSVRITIVDVPENRSASVVKGA